jgi:hypothetical protein
MQMTADTVAHSDIALAAERFPCVPPRLDGGRVAQMNAMIPCDIHGDFEIFQIAFITPASAQSIAV